MPAKTRDWDQHLPKVYPFQIKMVLSSPTDAIIESSWFQAMSATSDSCPTSLLRGFQASTFVSSDPKTLPPPNLVDDRFPVLIRVCFTRPGRNTLGHRLTDRGSISVRFRHRNHLPGNVHDVPTAPIAQVLLCVVRSHQLSCLTNVHAMVVMTHRYVCSKYTIILGLPRFLQLPWIRWAV